MMLAGRRRPGQTRTIRYGTMAGDTADPDKARRFRDVALPHLDDAYTFARYLLCNGADAEDAVQECYLRALRHFDTFRGDAIKPWLFAILRNVCRATYAQRHVATAAFDDGDDNAEPMWTVASETPEAHMLRQHDVETIAEMVRALPEPFREVIVLREINDLSYRAIAEIVNTPVGTVMSRLARARAMLRAAWIAANEGEPS